MCKACGAEVDRYGNFTCDCVAKLMRGEQIVYLTPAQKAAASRKRSAQKAAATRKRNASKESP